MDFAARLRRSPIAHDPDAGAEAAAAFADLGADLAALIGAAAGCSPYLAGLMSREGAWLREALAAPPESVVGGVLAPLPGLDLPELGTALRVAKRRVALYAALADLGGVWPLETVTGALTALADAACDSALCALVADEIRRGRI
ncbi:MAG: glutamine-synthetase adenylyltransferase, partial [Gemmobacter sp.]